jgi:type 2 lantibiotic biosynthesis protein LanM
LPEQDLPDLRTALLDVVAYCATLAERLGDPGFVPLEPPEPEVLADRERRWRKAAADEDPARFDALLASLDLDLGAARDALRDVRVRDPRRLPPWAEGFLRLLESAGFAARREPPEPDSSPDRASFGGAFVPFANVAERELERISRDHPVPFTAAARRQMVDYLVARWLMAGQAALTLECRLRQELESASGDPWDLPLDSAADWVELLGNHPLLLRLIGALYLGWEESVAQLVARLAADREDLARLLGGRAPGSVAACELGAGDSHRGGRTVAILTFEDGRKMVYKPRDVRPEAVFNEFLRRTNRWIEDLPLRVYDVLVRDGYGWVEFVHASPSREVGSAAAFYRRVGRLLRLLQLLGGHDLHWQNAILSEDQLVVLDLEGLLAVQPAHQNAGPGAAALRRLRESPLSTWVLPPVWSFGPHGSRPLDSSLLTAGGTGRTANNLLGARVDDSGLPVLVAGRLEHRIGSRQPVEGGRVRSPYEHAGDILQGYREMNGLIRSHGPELPLRELADLTVRFVPRNTAFYAGFLQMSLSPAYLQSGVDRDLFLHRLFQACREPGDRAAAQVVRAEVHALRDLDIPYCRNRVDCDGLLLDDETEVGGYLEEVPLRRLEARWQGFDGDELEEQLDLVRSSLDVSTGAPVNRCRGRSGPLGCGDGDWIGTAMTLGDKILAQATGEEDGGASFFGLYYLALHDVCEVAVLRPDVLSGVGGLAVVLADLFAATGERRFRDLAALLAGTVHTALVKTMENLEATCRDARARGETLLCGGLTGLGSLLYSLRRCRSALAEGALPEPAVTAREVALLAGLVPEDLVGGWAGLLMALLAEPRGAESLDAARLCAEELVAARRSGESRAAGLYPPDALLLRGLPDLQTGVAFALLRWAEVAGEAPVGVSPEGFMGAAATPGNLLARLRARRWSGDDEAGRLARRHLESLDRGSSGQDLLDGLELALEGERAIGDRWFRSRALEILGDLQGRHRETGSWFPDRLAADRHNLSAVTGLGALAHTLARWGSESSLRSLRLLD